jgi:hypothetical protein
MKCNQCGTENNLKERSAKQGRCKNCNHLFAFEPTSMGTVKFTDPFFAKAIGDLSANRTLYFTPKQLLYFLDRRLKGKTVSFSFVFLYFFFSIWAPGFIGGFLSIVIGGIAHPLVLIGFNIGCIFYLYILSNSPKSNPRVRRKSATTMQALGIFILLAGGIYAISTSSIVVYGLAALLGLSSIWLGFFQRRRSQAIPETFLITAAQMLGWLDRWSRINGAVDYLLPSPSSRLPASTPNPTPDPEVTAYSFDRLLVCQSDEIAQMLIANNFHFENNCAILGISGYPQRIFETAMQMLRRNPDLRVFALHDCSPEGIKLVYQLRTNPNWFPDESIAIVDVGLSPRQILAAKSDLFVQRTVSSAQSAQTLDRAIREKLATAELAWLDIGNYVELESFTPQKLLQVLRWTIAHSQQLDTVEEDSSLLVMGTGVGLFYAMESFG